MPNTFAPAPYGFATMNAANREQAKRIAELEAENEVARAVSAELGVNVAIAIQGLEIIAGEKQCLDNLMSHGDVAREALRMIRAIRALAKENNEDANHR